MDSLFGTEAAAQMTGSPAASNGAASRKNAKNGSKKCKNRSARYPKASNNPPYLPPEVSFLWFSRVQTHLSVLQRRTASVYVTAFINNVIYLYLLLFCISQGL